MSGNHNDDNDNSRRDNSEVDADIVVENASIEEVFRNETVHNHAIRRRMTVVTGQNEENLQPVGARGPRRAIINDTTPITRNHLAIILTLTFGVITVFGFAHLYKQIQTAYIVSSLMHNAPEAKMFIKRPHSSQPAPKSTTKSPAPSIDSQDLSSPVPTKPVLHSKLSPEVELYAQQLQKVLGSLKRAIRNVDKSENITNVGGIIEMRPMMDSTKGDVKEVPLEKSTPSSEVSQKTQSSPVPDSIFDSYKNSADRLTKVQEKANEILKDTAALEKKADVLMSAYTLAAEYASNLQKISDEQVRRTTALENGVEDEDEEFDLDAKKEENLHVFRKFVDLVTEAQTMELNDLENELLGGELKKDSKASDNTDPEIIKMSRPKLPSEIQGEDALSKTEQLHQLLSEALSADSAEWDDELQDYKDYDFESKIERAREVLAEIHMEEQDAELEKFVAKNEDLKKEKEEKTKENNSPVFS